MLTRTWATLEWTLLFLSSLQAAANQTWLHVWPLDISTCGYDVEASRDAIFPAMDNCRRRGSVPPFQALQALRLDAGYSPFIDLLLTNESQPDANSSLALNVRPSSLQGTLLDFRGQCCPSCIHELTVSVLPSGRLNVTIQAQDLDFSGQTWHDQSPGLGPLQWHFLAIGIDQSDELGSLVLQVDLQRWRLAVPGPRVRQPRLGLPATLRLGARQDGSDVFTGDVTCAAFFDRVIHPMMDDVRTKCTFSSRPFGAVTFDPSPLYLFPLYGENAGHDIITRTNRIQGNASFTTDDNVTALGYGSIYLTTVPLSLSMDLTGVTFTMGIYVFLEEHVTGCIASLQLKGNLVDIEYLVFVERGSSGDLQIKATGMFNDQVYSTATNTVTVPKPYGWSFVILRRVGWSIRVWIDSTEVIFTVFHFMQDNIVRFTLGKQVQGAMSYGCVSVLDQGIATGPAALRAITQSCLLPLQVRADLINASSCNQSLEESPTSDGAFPESSATLPSLSTTPEPSMMPSVIEERSAPPSPEPSLPTSATSAAWTVTPGSDSSATNDDTQCQGCDDTMVDSDRRRPTIMMNDEDTASTQSCMCRCKTAHHSLPLTSVQVKAASVAQELTVNKTATSASRRKYASVTDARASSTIMGAVGIGLVVFVGVLIVASDIPRMLEFLRACRKGRASDNM